MAGSYRTEWTVNPLVKETGYSEYGELGQLTMSTAATGKKHWQTFFYELGTRRLERDYFETQTAVRQQADIRYSYDLAGNLTRVADLTVNQTADVQCFRQDHLQRLTEAWTPTTDNCGSNPSTAGLGGPAAYWHSYRYDQVGNRTQEVQHATGGDTTRSYTYPAGGHAHALASVTTTKPGASTTTDSYGYNQTGDTTSRAVAGQPGHTLTWDPEGRLASDAANGQTTTFVYDADGARLVRRDPTHTTLYLPDGTELRCQRPSGPVVGTRYYSHAGRTIATRTGGVVTWLAADRHGTHNYAINATDLSVTRRRSLPFGAPRGAQPAWPGDKAFVGGTLDASTGLTHLGAREYDPTLGRFVSVDTLNRGRAIPFPTHLVSPGGRASDVGGQLWGHGNPGALLGTRTPEQLRGLMSRGDAETLQDFYSYVSNTIPSNKTAPVRVQLLQEVIDAWR